MSHGPFGSWMKAWAFSPEKGKNHHHIRFHGRPGRKSGCGNDQCWEKMCWAGNLILLLSAEWLPEEAQQGGGALSMLLSKGSQHRIFKPNDL